MKKILFLIQTTFFVVNSFSQTNVYHKFPTHDAIWGESYGSISGCAEYQNVIAGDTIIGLYTYHKIRQMGMTYICPYSFGQYFNRYIAAIREDTLAKKVYYYNTDFHPQEYLLYDFSLNIGDTLPQNSIMNTNMATNWVSAIDSVLIGNNYRKRLWISGFNGNTGGLTRANYTSLIEGIGNTFGLLSNIEPQLEYYPRLDCFMQDGINLYPDSSYPCATVSIYEMNKSPQTISFIAPNPFSDKTEITFNKSYKSVEFSIYNMQGKIIRKKTYYYIDKIELDRTDIENGFYLLRFVLDNVTIETKKIIITQ